MRTPIALAVVGALLASCTPRMPYLDSSVEPEPNYGAIIAQNLRSPRIEPAGNQQNADIKAGFFGERGNIFSDPKDIGFVEIANSGRRELNNTLGWTWMICIRAQVRNTRDTYAIFIAGNTIVDARHSVLTDRCDGLYYRPLDISHSETVRSSK